MLELTEVLALGHNIDILDNIRSSVKVRIRIKITDFAESRGVTTRMVLRISTHRRPTAPGEFILREFIEPLGITQTVLAQHLGITYHRLNEIVNGKRVRD